MIKSRWFIAVVVLLFIISYFSGFLTGWWRAKGTIGTFPVVTADTRLMVIAPHPDDEILIAGGLIQRVLSSGGKVKVIFLTSGDGSRETVIRENRKADLNPVEYLNLGEQRMQEAMTADSHLGLESSDLVFLGFPDRDLEKLFYKNFEPKDGVDTSSTTKFDHVPYQNALHPDQKYLGQNLLGDVKEVVDDFKPTIVVTTHIRDTHPDHKTAYQIAEKIKTQNGYTWPIYSEVVHFKGFPEGGDFIFPPKKLFGSGWVSLDLKDTERLNKLDALKLYVSQYENPDSKMLFVRMSAANEIFDGD